MLRTTISLCALLAALFFVFRGIQETTAQGQAIAPTASGAHAPSAARLMMLQRARQLHESAQRAAREEAETVAALEAALEEVESGWRLLKMLAEQESAEHEATAAVTQPAYAESVEVPQNEATESEVEVALPTEGTLAESDTASEAAVVTEATPPAPEPIQRQLTRSEQVLSNKIKHVLSVYRPKMEMAVNDKNCWEFMHTLIGYGVDNYAWVGRNRFNTIGYLCWNGKCRGFQLFENVNGQLKAKQGHGVQGHHGQFLAMLAQHRVDPSYTIKAGGKDFTIHDLVAFEQQTCEPKSELTFKLIALVHYLDSEATWTNKHGEWSIPRLIREELAQPVIGSACGGTHRLMGLSYAVRYREMRNEPITGEYRRAYDYVNAYHDYAFSLQNRNGSFSTKWFEARADNNDPQRYQETTGHITEWLAFSLPEERLHEPRMVEAVNFLANLMLENHDFDWKIGPRGHAIRALALYHERAFGERPAVQIAREARPGSNR